MVSSKVTAAINDILNEEGRLLTDADRARLVEEIKNELLGLGPLEPLLRDDEITDILVNGHDQVYVEKRGKLHPTDVDLPGRSASDADHRSHRLAGRPAGR